MKKRKIYYTNVYFKGDKNKALEFWDNNSYYFKSSNVNLEIVLIDDNLKNVCLGGEAYYTTCENVIFIEKDVF